MNNKKFVALALLVGLCMSAVGCANYGPGKDLIDREPVEDFVPTPDIDVDEELMAKYQSHKGNAPLAFKSNNENPASDFEYSEIDGCIQIDKYIGTADIVVIPAAIDGKSVTMLSESCFAESSVRAVYVPDSVKVIKSGAFENCKSLSTLRVPFVGNGEGDSNGGAIFGAEDYISNGLKVPGSLKMLIIGEGVDEIKANAFANFKSLEAIILPQSAKKIGQFAFSECRSLVYVDLGGVKVIDEYAFLLCQSLISIEIPDHVTEISLGAFMQCESLKYLSLPFVGSSREENQYIGYIFGSENLAWNNSFVPVSLSYVALRCKDVPAEAFEGCENIIDLVLYEVESIGERAFSNCKSLQSVIFTESIKNISANAFANCYTLKKLEFSANSKLESIGLQAFMNCKSLESVKLPSKVVELPVGVFHGCGSLVSIEAVNVTTVGANAFLGANSLFSVSGISANGVDKQGNTKLLEILEK